MSELCGKSPVVGGAVAVMPLISPGSHRGQTRLDVGQGASLFGEADVIALLILIPLSQAAHYLMSLFHPVIDVRPTFSGNATRLNQLDQLLVSPAGAQTDIDGAKPFLSQATNDVLRTRRSGEDRVA